MVCTVVLSWVFQIALAWGMKKVMYLVAWHAIQSEKEWASLYKRLVPQLCTYDEQTQTYKGRRKAIGHVIGRLITLGVRAELEQALTDAQLGQQGQP